MAENCSIQKSICMVVRHRCAAFCPTSLIAFGRARSILARSSTWNCPWSKRRRAIGPWMSAALSRRCCAHKQEERREYYVHAERGDLTMTSWTQKDLERIGAADELRLPSFREDGTPLRYDLGCSRG